MKYMKGNGNLSFGSVKRPKGPNRQICFIKSEKRSIFVIDSYLDDNALRGMGNEYHLSIEGI